MKYKEVELNEEILALIADEIGVRATTIREIEIPEVVPADWEVMPIHVFFFTTPSRQIEVDLDSELAHLLLQ